MPWAFHGISHYKESNFKTILTFINNIINIGLMNNDISNALFSYNLGILNHYLADYFCSPHDDRKQYEGHLRSHLLYEKDLHQYARSINVVDTLTIPDIKSARQSHIIDFIEELLGEYREQKVSYERDLTYAINACRSINVTLIKEAVTSNQLVYV